MSNYNIIKEAILNNKSVTFTYRNKIRLMSPHVLGKKKGNYQASFFQYGGESNRGLSEDKSKNWRCIFMSEITDLHINNDGFYSVDNYSPILQNCVDNIEVAVEVDSFVFLN